MHRKTRLIPKLKLLNELLANNFVTFRDKLNKFNNTGAQMLGSIYC